MAKAWLPVFLQIVLLHRTIFCQYSRTPRTPCPQIFQYNWEGRWVGILSVPPPHLGGTLRVRVDLSVGVRLPSSYYGKIEMVDDKNIVLNRIVNNDLRPVQYRLHFPVTNPLPQVTDVLVNDCLICSGPQANGRVVTSINLQHTFYTSPNPIPQDTWILEYEVRKRRAVSSGCVSLLHPEPTTSRPPPNTNSWFTSVFTWQPEVTTTERPRRPFWHTTPRIHVTEATTTQRIESEASCGISFRVNPLVINGKDTSRRDWPWQVAIFIKNSLGLQFQCGGNLINNRHVLTAAHCIQNRFKERRPTNAFVIYMGKYNIRQWTEIGNQPREADQIFIHPDWGRNPSGVWDADLAVIRLDTPVEYSTYVQPICLWDRETNLELIVGTLGITVGWGRYSEDSSVSDVLKQASIPVVSQEQCIRSKEDFAVLTTNRTLCAGFRNGTGPCTGDSGGGYVFHLPDALGKRKWYLRGIISFSLPDEEHACNLKEYIVFTDVAKYLGWLNRFMT